MVVPNSSHASEFTLITPVLDTSTPISYIVNGDSRTIRESNGQVYSLIKNSTWEPLPTTPGQAHTLTLVSSVITDGSKTYTTEIYASNRTMQPSRWRSKCVDGTGVVYDRFWLRRGGGDLVSFISPQPTPPAGGATDYNERWWERFWVTGTDPATMAFHHNPTMAGAGDRPDGTAIPPDLGVSSKMYTGRPITYTARSQQGPTSGAFIEGACAPLDFGGDPGNYEYSDHGYGIGNDSEDQPAWWWRMRMWRRFYPNYNNMPRITKSEGGSWFPVEWNNNGISNPILAQYVENFDLVPSAFNKCYLINVSSGQYQELSTVYPTLGGGITPAGYFSQHNIARHRNSSVYDATINLPAKSLSVAPYPAYDSPYLALAYLDTTTGFCFAIATKILPCTNLSEDSRDDTNDACQFQAWHREYTHTTPLLETSNEGDIAYIVHKSRIKRNSGWLFRKTFIYTGEFSSVVTDFQSLLSNGEFDSNLTVADVPQEVLDSLQGDLFEVIGMDDITKSPLERFTCATNDGTSIYLGSDSISGNGHVWKYNLDEGWVRITENLSNATAKSISTIKYHDGKLYAGTQGSSLAYGTGQLWINSGDGQGWINPIAYWAGSTNVALRTLLFKDGDLYTAGSYFDVVKYSSAGNWSQIFGYLDNFVAAGGPSSVVTHDLETDGTNIYAGMSTLLLSSVVMKYDGTTWTRISPYGFGDYRNSAISKLKWHNNKLYAATLNQLTGPEVWEYDGTTWQQINTDGFGVNGSFNVVSIEVINNNLLFSVEGIYGGKVFSYSPNGEWEEIVINSEVKYASYLIQKVGNSNYLIGTRRKNLITNSSPSSFITFAMKESASANYFPDGQMGMIPIENNKYRFFGPNSLWQLVSDGSMDNPFENVRSTLQYSKGLNNYNPSKFGYTVATDFLEKKADFAYYNPSSESDLVGLPNVRYNSGGLVHQVPGTSTVILWVHTEEGYWDTTSVSAQFGGPYWNGLIRQAVSFDNGLTFYDCGRLIESAYPARPNTATSGMGNGLGLGGYVIKDGYIYLYYNGDGVTSGPPSPRITSLSVARAQYSEFIASALNKQVCVWQKYHNGSFSQPAINGSSTDLINFYGGNVGWTVGMNSSSLNNICYFISTKLHYIDFNSFYDVNTNYPWDPITPEDPYSFNWDNQSYVLFSENGIDWSFPEKISSFDTSCIYTFPLSFSGHIGELSNQFKILGQRSAPWDFTDEQGGISTKQQTVIVQPFRQITRGFTEGVYSNNNSKLKIFTKVNNEWSSVIPFVKRNNQWKFSYPFLKSTNDWIQSFPIKQGKEEVDLYFYIGDSIAADSNGSAIDFLSYSEYSGLYSSVPGCHLFRFVECPQTTGEFGSFTQPRFEEYRTGVNTNSINPDANGAAGADIVLFDKLKKSSNNDVYVLKAAWPGSRFVQESGQFDWSPRSQNQELFGDLFKIYYDSFIVPGLNWLKLNNKNPIFKGGFITLGTNIPEYISKQEFTKEQINLDSSGLVSGLIQKFKDNSINTDVAKIVWIIPDRTRLFSIPDVPEPFRSDYVEYHNAVASSVSNLSSIFNRVSWYDPSAWASLSSDYGHPSTSGHVKIAESVFNLLFTVGVGLLILMI